MGATQGFSEVWKAKLVKSGKVYCGHCRYHRGENAKHKVKDDRYKNHR